MKTPQKHAETIKAWADGAEIEIRLSHGEWSLVAYPAWGGAEYRIKPEPNPDVVEYRNESTYNKSKPMCPNLQLTFCGEKGQLKSAVVL
tara:strand:- start:3 stop:269 length:267 start_codon:yes stop_codon:yes gene_type:complete